MGPDPVKGWRWRRKKDDHSESSKSCAFISRGRAMFCKAVLSRKRMLTIKIMSFLKRDTACEEKPQ